ncbi:molybdate transport system substrate-binding protein [Sinomicrobium oceani]|uniref:Molybdate transport system substrate-binding protein n=1 Tax=Sinomicrobium oceani TaxID=1150368 RepID=A0A1K1R4A4_9FLAO|nr:molybdate ABC transporter substrate-binding protein [Sinomicrobium oceani]SFW66683.1 molybdate transport system substrate-binding protein [Sinomicrobium oceani]
MTLTVKIAVYGMLMLCCLACSPAHQAKITVATAANMKFAMQPLLADFTEKTGVECEMIVGSSGKLTAQIREGAPYDIFVSADMKYPQTLYEEGVAKAPPEIYAYGRLILWSVNGAIPALTALPHPDVGHIALANPRNAPYGAAAVAVLKHYGIWDTVQDKLVYGESISQTNHFIMSGAATVGFTALSVVRSPDIEGKGRYIIPDPETYPPIAQGVVLIPQPDTDPEQAGKFYDYLFSPEARKVLKDFGYLVDE